METVETWGDAVMVSATEALQNFLGFLPALVGAILILVIGWIIAGLLAALVERVLKTVGFERAANTTGISGFIERSGSSWTASAIVAEIVKWFIRLIAIQAAASVLGLDQISQIINAILLWLPNLVVAIAIIVIGGPLVFAILPILIGGAVIAFLEIARRRQAAQSMDKFREEAKTEKTEFTARDRETLV